MKSLLADEGFHVQSIGSIHLGLGYAAFSDIKLDKDGNSTIGLIQTPISPFRPSKLYIKDLNLSGELGPNGMLLIDGWDLKPVAYPSGLETVILDYGRLDLITPAGAIRLEAKGQLTANTPSSRHVDAVVYSNQKQLGFDTQWDIKWNADGTWNADGEIGDFRTQLGNFEVARAAGWLNLRAGASATAPVIGAQLSAGLMTFGPAVLRNAGLTVSGPYGAFDLILNGTPADPQSMQFSAEAKQNEKQNTLNATISAVSFNDLIVFLEKIHTGMNANTELTSRPFMVLLLTQGNYDRMRKQLGGTTFASYALQLTGPVNELAGSILAKGPGAQKASVSFDPVSKN